MAVAPNASEQAWIADQELTDIAHHSEVGADSQICVPAAQKEPTSAQDVH
jgi:hypothetical protein